MSDYARTCAVTPYAPEATQDQREAFLRDLRGLRKRRGLSLEELAARSGSTAEQQAAVETGPWLPPLPALESYLRGCGEQLARWEDRWRRLTRGGLAAAGDLPVREAGTSPLAAAGAALAAAESPALPARQAPAS